MANRPLLEDAPPADWRPTQAVPDPIINGPYDEPKRHWLYRGGSPEIQDFRREASYWFKEKRLGKKERSLLEGIEREENRDDLPLVNALRKDVRRWRVAEYRGATTVTKELLAYWTREDRPRRLFFCQRESVETIIYLLELAIPGRLAATGFKNFKVDADNVAKLLRGEKPTFEALATAEFFPRLVDPPVDPGLIALRRLGCKMATGSGKTLVMAMLVSWAFCNRGNNPASRQFPNAVLVCAPNLTVRKRLKVLIPSDPDNYYDAFDLVPSRHREHLNSGKVLVTNWHKFGPKSEHEEGGTSYRVVDKGEEPTDAFTKDRLGDLAARLPILVLNDEGHHCWRPKPTLSEKDEKEALKDLAKEEKEALKDEAEEARVWLAGLDKINNSGLAGKDAGGVPLPAVLACIDLSATPFYLGNSGYPEGSPFPWLVSDFGLVDAIECGITKVPRLPVADDTKQKDDAGRPDPKYFRLWKTVVESCQTLEKNKHAPKPDAVYKYAQDALLTLASQWKVQFEETERKAAGGEFVPPVLIVVCDNTEVSQVFYEKIAGERDEEVPDEEDPRKTRVMKRYGGGEVFPELLANRDGSQRTIRIDSKLLAKIESEEGQTKDQAALKLRELIDTVGKRGGLGEHVRCVVSVSMLTEGWDANNVTHILGVRAFGSQLLCEQVVGRGSRRMNYEPDPDTGLLKPEYVDVYGIPFSLIPYKGKPIDDEPRPDPVYHSIYSVEERSAFEIRVPNVEGYVYELRDQGIRCDVSSLEPIHVEATPGEVWLRPTRGYHDDDSSHTDSGDFVKQTREEYYKTVRPQQLIFRLAQMVLDQLTRGVAEEDDRRKAELKLRARHQLFPEIVAIVQKYVHDPTKVILKPGLDLRELGLERYANQVVERIRDSILPAAAEPGRLIPVENRFRRFNSTADVDYQTTRPVVDLTKSHLNRAAVLSGWEALAVDILEDLDCVECYTPNDRRIGLLIPYEYDGEPRSYEPDFFVRMRGGVTVMLEIKGGKGKVHNQDLVPAKNAAAKKWCAAVSNLGKYGRWEFEICENLGELRVTLTRHAGGEAELPFEIVDPASAEIWKDCVPLTSLRTVATKGGQKSLADGAWASDLVTWEGRPPFEPGMFAAKVLGDAMEPEIPAGSYCLFRQAGGDREGKILFVKRSGLSDPHTGGDWTVRRYERADTGPPADDWSQRRILLRPANDGVPPYIVDVPSEDDLAVLGEVVAVLGVRGIAEDIDRITLA